MNTISAIYEEKPEMQELSWIDHLPSGALEGGIALLNKLRWHIRYEKAKTGPGWVVMTGHSVIFKGSKASVDAFLYGMALSCAHMPKKMVEELRNYMLRQEGFDPENPPEDDS
jgi:hypothetical protein